MAAGAAVAGGLAGCAGARGAAAPTPSPAATSVPFQLWVMFPNGLSVTSAPARKVIQEFFDQQFNAQHKTMRAVYTGWTGDTGPMVTEILAGGPSPAVIAAWGPTWPAIVPFLQPLDPYLRADNVPETLWQARSLAQVRGPQGLFALPHDASTQSYLYRQDVLDSLGLAYPDASWTSDDAARLWTSCTSKQKQRVGATIPWSGTGPFPGEALLNGFGGALMDPTGTKCLLASPGSTRAAQWAMPLYWDGVWRSNGGIPNKGLATGQMVFSQGSADWSLLWAVENLGSRVKWDFLPFPRWPSGSASIFQSEFYGINATFKPQEYAWELFRFLAVDPTWQRFNMRLTLNAPGLVSLLQEWASVLTSVAPVLKSKALGSWTDPALHGEGYPAWQYFHFAPTQAQTIIGDGWGQIWNRHTGVTAGLQSIAQQVDALETAASAEGQKTGSQQIAAHQTAKQRLDEMFAAGAPVTG